MELQKNIKDNAEDLRGIVNEMSTWEKEMKRKENSLLENENADTCDDLPPVRTKLRKEEKNLNNEKIIKSESTIPTNDYSYREKSLVEKDLGNEFVKQGKWTDAILHYNAAIDFYSEDPTFFCNRAQCYLQTKQWAEAVTDCNRAIELDCSYVKAHYRKGLALKELNNITEARRSLLKALDLEPANQNIKNDLLLLNELLGDQISNSNTNDFESNLSDHQKREKSLYEKERGNSCVAKKEWTDAIHHYTEAINCFSKDATFYCNRALCFLQVEKFKEAETDCTTALQLDPEYVKAYHRRGLALKELNQLKEALENFQKALDLDPKNACINKDFMKLEKRMNETNLLKGNQFVQKKDWKSAIECYTEACKLYPDDVSFNLNRALCFLKTKEPKKTLLDCTLVLERDPENVKAYFRRAEAHETLQNYSKAHDDFLSAFRLDSSDQTIQNRLTRLEKKMGILPPEPVRSEVQNVVENEPLSKAAPPTRLTGEKFLKLGGSFVQPLKKLPHQVSTKPLTTVRIANKNEDPLKSAFEEISVADFNKNSSTEEKNVENVKYLGSSNSENEESENVNVSELPVPKTSMQFTSAWDKLNSPESQFLYLKRIRGEDLPQIFKEALESYIFSEILETLSTEFVKYDEPVYHYLLGLSRVKRIKALLLFASEEDNANIKTLLSHAKKLNETSENELNELKKFYYC
ncbi:hypothetical protein V9T40_013904 [Parthenolecanium corni]|uniref:RNA polymerase II-associated protein 3 n=1 Tax=Parthenolecanium corni TaxID=536013 RepID=A0AAN9Y1M9_9HEMI